MANVIAIVWDFDKTLVDGYMQDPIFEEYGVDAAAFWAEVNALPEKYEREQGVRVNPDTVYLNQFIRYAKEGKFPGLNNEKLKEFGKKLKFYKGVPEIFDAVRKAVEDDPIYQEYDIRVEHYVVSTGMLKIIEGSSVADKMEHIWGCELIEEEIDGERIISEVGYTIDNTSKTRALFEINKGVHRPDRGDINVNSNVPEELRRVQFINMVYVADGPSDIPSFSLVNKHGGSTFAIYPRGDMKALRQVEQMREEGRIQMFAEADYSEGTTAHMWLCNKVQECARRMRDDERRRLSDGSSSAPVHLS